jgi:hypothetical protein
MGSGVFRGCTSLESIKLRNFSKETSSRSWTGAFTGIQNTELGEVSTVNNIGFKGMTSSEAWDFLKIHCGLDVNGDTDPEHDPPFYMGWVSAPKPII